MSYFWQSESQREPRNSIFIGQLYRINTTSQDAHRAVMVRTVRLMGLIWLHSFSVNGEPRAILPECVNNIFYAVLDNVGRN